MIESGQRQANGEGGAFAGRIVASADLAAVTANDAIADAESQSCSLADFFGGEKRIEDSLGIGDAAAVIAEGNLDSAIAQLGGDLDAAAATRIAHRVISVVQDVEADLLQLVRIA